MSLLSAMNAASQGMTVSRVRLENATHTSLNAYDPNFKPNEVTTKEGFGEALDAAMGGDAVEAEVTPDEDALPAGRGLAAKAAADVLSAQTQLSTNSNMFRLLHEVATDSLQIGRNS